MAETVLGDALTGERRQSLEIFTKVFGPTGLKGHNDVGLSRKHILESIDGSLTRLRDSGHGVRVLVRSGASFDLVAQDEIGAGVAGLGGGEVLTEFGNGGGGARGG